MDEVDKKIIAQLQADGRTSLEDLSKMTGFTSMGIKKRLEKLIKNGTIKISALINPMCAWASSCYSNAGNGEC